MEKIYLAFKNSELFAYSFDINEFFSYLQNYYTIHGSHEITIQKIKFENSMYEYIQCTNPEYEILEFVDGVLLTGVEKNYWDSYFRGFYCNIEDMVAKQKGTKMTRSYEEFLVYLGSEKIQSIVNGLDHDFILSEYKSLQEFSEIIKDK